MSIVFCALLIILVFLRFSSHACGFRTPGVVVDGHHSMSKESDVKLNPVSNKASMANDDATRDDRRVENGRDKVGSEPWRVPHRKKGEREAGFNLDYLPPKTHPPVHN